MFIAGHIEIINDVLTLLPNTYFDLSYKYKFFTKEKIIKGLQYVDLPCGIYEVDKNHLIFHSKDLCNYYKLLSLLNDVPNENNINIFQYHKGFFAFLHSMTTDPQNTNRKIRNKIILSIIGFALLAIYDDKIYSKKIYPNALWIGFIIHIITDSYSPSHTIRDQNIKYKINNRSKTNTDKLNKDLNKYYNIKDLAKDKIIYSSEKFEAKSEYDLYKLLKFNFDIDKIADIYLQKFSLKETKEYTNGDIISFQYYLNQPIFMHQNLDLLYNVKNNKNLYNKMLNECLQLLLIYKKCLITKNVNKYINDVIDLMINHTFKMSKENLNSLSNKIYDFYRFY